MAKMFMKTIATLMQTQIQNTLNARFSFMSQADTDDLYTVTVRYKNKKYCY